MPSINALQEEFRDRGLTVLLINMKESREIVLRAVATRAYTATVVLDANREVADSYRVTGTSTVYLLDRQLQVFGRAIGRREWASMDGRRLLAVLLATPTGRR